MADLSAVVETAVFISFFFVFMKLLCWIREMFSECFSGCSTETYTLKSFHCFTLYAIHKKNQIGSPWVWSSLLNVWHKGISINDSCSQRIFTWIKKTVALMKPWIKIFECRFEFCWCRHATFVLIHISIEYAYTINNNHRNFFFYLPQYSQMDRIMNYRHSYTQT